MVTIFQPSITQVVVSKWSRHGKASLVDGKVRLPADSSMELVIKPASAAEKAISLYYRVKVTFEVPPTMMHDKATSFLTLKFFGEDESDVVFHTTAVIHPRSGETIEITRKIASTGGIFSKLNVVVENTGGEAFTVSSVTVEPSYDMDQSTLGELDRILPAIQHEENSSVLVLDTYESTLANVDIAVADDTNLLVHFMLNFDSTISTTATLSFTINTEHVSYSPLRVPIYPGPNLIGIPVNLMNLPIGDNKLKITCQLASGVVYVEPYKMQLTLDGRNLISKTGSGAPSVHEQLQIIPFEDMPFTFNVRGALVEVERVSFRQAIDTSKAKSNIGLAVNISQARVAEDINFTEAESASFEYAASIQLYNGALQFKHSSAAVQEFDVVEEYEEGAVYALSLDNSLVESYSSFSIQRVTMETDSVNMLSQYPDISSDKSGYYCSQGALHITTEHPQKLSEVQQLATCTYAQLKFDRDAFSIVEAFQ